MSKSSHYSVATPPHSSHTSQSPVCSAPQIVSPVTSSPQLIPTSQAHLPHQAVVLVPTHSSGPPPLGAHYVQPYNFVQPVTTTTPPPSFSHHQFPHSPGGPHHPLHGLHPHTAYVTSFSYPNQPTSFASLPPNMYHTANSPHLRGLPPNVQVCI